jgi:cytoskeletal protein CcmA (bactofilin family)
MRRVFLSLLAVVLAVLLAPGPALAAEIRGGDAVVVVGPGETIEDDLYVAGQSVTIQGQVKGSVFAAGSSVTVTGVVTGDLFAAANTVDVPGVVAGSVRAAGGNVALGGTIGRDAMVGAGSAVLAPGARVGRDLFLGAGSARVAAPVGRGLFASADQLTLAAPVAGSVQASVGTLRLEDGASVGGDLRYASAREATVAPGAAVRGTIARAEPPAAPAQPTASVAALDALAGWLRGLTGVLALGLALVLLFPRATTRAADALAAAPLASAGIGLAELVLVPVAALTLFGLGLVVGGWWLGLFVAGAYPLALVVGYVVAGLMVGRWLMARAGRGAEPPAWAIVAGLVALALVAVVPILGALTTLVALTMGVGATTIALHGIWRGAVPAAPPAQLPLAPVQDLRESA